MPGPSAVLTAKACLIDNVVGRTSLVRRYLPDQFDEGYLSTLGAKVTKQELGLDEFKGGGPVLVDLTVWDIMGQSSFPEPLRDACFWEAQTVLAVAHLRRRETLDRLCAWIDAVVRTARSAPAVVAANKADLVAYGAFGQYGRRIHRLGGGRRQRGSGLPAPRDPSPRAHVSVSQP